MKRERQTETETEASGQGRERASYTARVGAGSGAGVSIVEPCNMAKNASVSCGLGVPAVCSVGRTTMRHVVGRSCMQWQLTVQCAQRAGLWAVLREICDTVDRREAFARCVGCLVCLPTSASDALLKA